MRKTFHFYSTVLQKQWQVKTRAMDRTRSRSMLNQNAVYLDTRYERRGMSREGGEWENNWESTNVKLRKTRQTRGYWLSRLSGGGSASRRSGEEATRYQSCVKVCVCVCVCACVWMWLWMWRRGWRLEYSFYSWSGAGKRVRKRWGRGQVKERSVAYRVRRGNRQAARVLVVSTRCTTYNARSPLVAWVWGWVCCWREEEHRRGGITLNSVHP